MKNRVLLIIVTTLITFNIGAVLLNLKENGFNWDSAFTLKWHYEVSIYALKCSLIGIFVDWVSRNLYKK